MRRLGWLGAILLLAALAVGGWAGVLLGIAGLAALLGAAYIPGSGVVLVGPLAGWTLVRAARRGRPFSARVLLMAAALAILMAVVRYGYFILPDPTATIPWKDATELCEVAFGWTAAGLLLYGWVRAVFALPAAVAEEREAGRLDHLLVTDLRGREILVGRAVGMGVPVLAELLVPVPLMLGLGLWGGLHAGVAIAAGVLAVGLLAGTLGLALAAGGRRVTAAVGRTALLVVAFLTLTGAASWAAKSGRWSLAVAELLDWVGLGNPLVFADRLLGPWVDPPDADALIAAARPFLAVNLAILLGGVYLAARRLRPTATGRWRFPRPRLRWWAVPAGVFAVLLAFRLADTNSHARLARGLFQASGPLSLLFVMIPAGWAAARRVPLERQLGTLDALLLTDLTAEEIVRRAWKQGLRAVAGPAAGFAALFGYLFAVRVLGGPTPGRIALAAADIAAGAGLAAAAGVLVSVPAPTPRRALNYLMFGAVYWSVAWVAWWVGGSSPVASWAVYGLVPGVALTTFTADGRDPAAVVGNMAFSAVAAGLLLAVAGRWFHRRVRPKPEAPT